MEASDELAGLCSPPPVPQEASSPAIAKAPRAEPSVPGFLTIDTFAILPPLVCPAVLWARRCAFPVRLQYAPRTAVEPVTASGSSRRSDGCAPGGRCTRRNSSWSRQLRLGQVRPSPNGRVNYLARHPSRASQQTSAAGRQLRSGSEDKPQTRMMRRPHHKSATLACVTAQPLPIRITLGDRSSQTKCGRRKVMR